MTSTQACTMDCKSENIRKEKAPKARRKLKEIERNFVCNILGCSRIYASEQSLKQHKKRKHKFFSAHEENKRAQMLERESFHMHLVATRMDKHQQMYQRLSAARASCTPFPRAAAPCQTNDWRQHRVAQSVAYSNGENRENARTASIQKCSPRGHSHVDVLMAADNFVDSSRTIGLGRVTFPTGSDTDEVATIDEEQDSMCLSSDCLDSAFSLHCQQQSLGQDLIMNTNGVDVLSGVDSFIFPELALLDQSDLFDQANNAVTKNIDPLNMNNDIGFGPDVHNLLGQDIFSDNLHIELNADYGLNATSNSFNDILSREDSISTICSPQMQANRFSFSSFSDGIDFGASVGLARSDSFSSDSASSRGSVQDLQLHSISTASLIDAGPSDNGEVLNQIMELIEANRRINFQLMSLS
ncbi:hypothetical protein SARC_14244 [Sphaeroforma arctica JP610]|uniref:C2H2-type domain-containing protein n=1 Tax=Sphaeroforma arctica JP610 TaxID=667725 RepID=A0A0L0F902_9EUKA|nr:hypothetical protein SARC_14244 [Sphaeroforma arctica JP610]KNC73197.1 hypothetical protein SARC_14244 [Sphaeroforma arctica JP610]|eukprot:XP_014147099.1 hypothetical protein SARC_14244 [Sphaeroforma arctica JP610]